MNAKREERHLSDGLATMGREQKEQFGVSFCGWSALIRKAKNLKAQKKREFVNVFESFGLKKKERVDVNSALIKKERVDLQFYQVCLKFLAAFFNFYDYLKQF